MAHDDDPNFVLAAATVLPVLAIIAVILRFYVRTTQKAKVGVDDWLALLGLGFVISLGCLLIVGVKSKAYGYPTKEKSQSILAAKLEYAFQPLQIFAVGSIKLSFLFFYRRIFVTGSSTRNLFGKITFGTIILILLWMLSFVFAFFFSCGKHISAHWNEEILRAKCDKGLKAENALAISDFITDLVVFVMPIPMILRLHMTTARKIAVLAIFGVGFVALASSLVRMILFIHLTKLAAGTKNDNDLVITRGLYWGMVEAGLAIIACCLPTLHVILIKTSVESIVRSIRSVVSLQSMNSTRSRNHSKRAGDSDANGTDSIASQSKMVLDHSNPASIHAYVMGDVPKTSGEEGNLVENKIWVNSKLEQTSSAV